MRKVFSVNDISWQNLRGLPGARGFEYKALSDADYSSAFSAELVRLEPGDHSVPHIEPWSHLLYFLSGTGDVTINGETQPVAMGTVCQIKAGQKHSLRNLGGDEERQRFGISKPKLGADKASSPQHDEYAGRREYDEVLQSARHERGHPELPNAGTNPRVADHGYARHEPRMRPSYSVKRADWKGLGCEKH